MQYYRIIFQKLPVAVTVVVVDFIKHYCYYYHVVVNFIALIVVVDCYSFVVVDVELAFVAVVA